MLNTHRNDSWPCLRGLLICLISALTPHHVYAAASQDTQAADTVDVYILSGQSNMVGSGRVAELPDLWKQPIDGAMIFDGTSYQTLVATRQKGFGPEIGFAHYLRNNQPGRPEIYLIKFALSGQPLDAGWTKSTAKGGGWVGPEPGPDRMTFYPGTSSEDPNVGLHYQRLHKHVDKAMKALKDDGLTPRLRGIVWMQGEADAKHPISAGRYDRSLALLKSRIEEDFANDQEVPFVFGQVLPYPKPLPRFIARDVIRQSMADADWRSGSDRAVPNLWMVSTDGMALKKDTVHYSTPGVLAMGQAFGLEMLKAHRKAEQDHHR